MSRQNFCIAMFAVNAVLFVFSTFVVQDVPAAFINIFGCLLCLLSLYLTNWTERLRLKNKNNPGEDNVDKQ